MAKKRKKSGGMPSVKTHSGLNKERMKKSGGGGGSGTYRWRLKWPKEGGEFPLQFLTDIDGFVEYDIHGFREDGRWQFVPCIGEDDCPLCHHEDSNVRGLSYRFIANVYNHASGEVQVLEGPKDLGSRIWSRRDKIEKSEDFLRRVWDVARFATKPISYDVSRSETKPRNPKSMKLYDLQEYLDGELVDYYGEDGPSSISALEADLDEEWDDDSADDDDSDTWSDADDSEDSFEDEWDEDDSDEEEEPPKKKSKSKSKSSKSSSSSRRRRR